jgi:hypothetical protein
MLDSPEIDARQDHGEDLKFASINPDLPVDYSFFSHRAAARPSDSAAVV